MEKEINELIKKASEKFGVMNLSSGNCGVFALALGRLLSEKGLEPKINFLFKFREDENINTIDNLSNSEPDIYHVVLSLNDKIYDGTGETSIEKLLELSVREYNDFEPMYLKDVGLEENALRAVIEFDTNWFIPEYDFYSFLKRETLKLNTNDSSKKRSRP